ncbi:MAG TPA: immunoglobulin-like domain-containing protein [Pyrinomonadaceae bacterium]
MSSQASSESSNPQAPIKNRKSGITKADALFVEQSGPLASSFPALEQYLPLAALAQAAPGAETVTLYAGPGCTVPKTVFELGDVACAKVTGIPLGASRRIAWVDPEGFIERTASIVSDGQTDQWTNPSTPEGLIAGTFVVRNRGTWRANLITSRGSVLASAFYTVKDPANAEVDLSINLSALGDDSPTAGSQVQYAVNISNEGPSDAANVHFVDSEFVNATLDSVTQTGGTQNAFTCTDNGSVDCSIASFPAGARAQFLLNFTAGAAGSTIDNKASVSSDTTELYAGDNESMAQPLRVTTGGAPAACVLECQSNITVTAPVGQTSATVTFGSPEAFGTCGTVTMSHTSGSSFPIGSTVVTATSSQGGGSCSFTITVIDSDPPTISCPANKTVTAADGECSATVDPGTPTATGNNVEVTGVRSDGQALDAPYPGGTTTITWTATDAEGRTVTCTQTITVNVNDTTPPTITAPPNLTLTTGASEESSCGTIVSETKLTPEADDNCSFNISRTGVPAGNFFPIGTTTVTYTVTDAGGNTATATQTITVSDNTPPVVIANGDDPLTPDINEAPALTVECGGAIVDPGATAKDSCVGPVAVTTNVNSIDTHVPGTYTLVYSATDGTNTGTASRTVNVVDTTPPVIALNGANPMTVECHSTFVDPGATANDGCAGSFAATPSGTVDANTPGTYSITYTATDPSGNAATPVTRTVNVVDTLAPVITLNGANPMTVECHTSFTDPGATAHDACNGPVGVVASGSVNVNVPGSYTITYTSTDGAHSSTATRTVNVVDTTAPVISCPADIVVHLPLNSPATSMVVNYPAPTATDSCSSNVTVTTSKASGSIFNMGPTVVTATATDPAGNSSSCSFTVTVLYNFTGFFQPVDNLPTLNQVNAGKAIPVKFSLSGNKGLNIFAPNSPSSGVIQCGTNDPVVDIEETVTAGGSSLSYTAGSDQYNYVWKTESSWAGTCRQLVLQLNDGSVHRANFKFK